MFTNHDPGDVTGLEALFESRHFGRTAGTGGTGLAAAVRPPGLEEAILAMEFGDGARGLTVRGVSESDTTDDAPRKEALPAPSEPPSLPPDSALPVASAGGAASGNGEPPVPSAPSPKRGGNSYRMIAVASCVAALVVAGVTSQAGQKRQPTVSALGGHRAGGHTASRDRNDTPSLGTPSSDTPTPGTSAAGGSAGPGAGTRPSVSLASSTSGARGAPGGHVSVSGAATDNGTPPSSSSSPGPGGSAPSPPGSGGSPGTPVGSLVASTLNTVAASASTVSGQLGSSVPGAGPVTDALGAAISGVSQAVGPTTS